MKNSEFHDCSFADAVSELPDRFFIGIADADASDDPPSCARKDMSTMTKSVLRTFMTLAVALAASIGPNAQNKEKTMEHQVFYRTGNRLA